MSRTFCRDCNRTVILRYEGGSWVKYDSSEKTHRCHVKKLPRRPWPPKKEEPTPVVDRPAE